MKHLKYMLIGLIPLVVGWGLILAISLLPDWIAVVVICCIFGWVIGMLVDSTIPSEETSDPRGGQYG